MKSNKILRSVGVLALTGALIVPGALALSGCGKTKEDPQYSVDPLIIAQQSYDGGIYLTCTSQDYLNSIQWGDLEYEFKGTWRSITSSYNMKDSLISYSEVQDMVGQELSVKLRVKETDKYKASTPKSLSAITIGKKRDDINFDLVKRAEENGEARDYEPENMGYYSNYDDVDGLYYKLNNGRVYFRVVYKSSEDNQYHTANGTNALFSSAEDDGAILEYHVLTNSESTLGSSYFDFTPDLEWKSSGSFDPQEVNSQEVKVAVRFKRTAGVVENTTQFAQGKVSIYTLDLG